MWWNMFIKVVLNCSFWMIQHTCWKQTSKCPGHSWSQSIASSIVPLLWGLFPLGELLGQRCSCVFHKAWNNNFRLTDHLFSRFLQITHIQSTWLTRFLTFTSKDEKQCCEVTKLNCTQMCWLQHCLYLFGYKHTSILRDFGAHSLGHYMRSSAVFLSCSHSLIAYTILNVFQNCNFLLSNSVIWIPFQSHAYPPYHICPIFVLLNTHCVEVIIGCAFIYQ